MLEGQACKGRAPWLPHPEASNLDVWDLNGVPTLGTFEIGESTYIFMGADGRDCAAIPWAYARLDASEVSAISDIAFDSVGEMYAYARRLFESKDVTVADAEEHGIVRWSEHNLAESGESVLSAMVKHLESVVALLEEEVRDLERQKRERAAIRKADSAAPVRRSAAHFRELVPA